MVKSMQFTDAAIILTTRKLGEHSIMVRALTQEHGVYAGAVRGGHSKQQRGLWQPGNQVDLTWKARLAEQVGSFSGELHEAVAAYAMQDRAALSALTSATTLIHTLVPERAPHPMLYRALHDFTQAIVTKEWQLAYARFELALLSECGFQLDLSSCAATGRKEDLIYVSPKSGHAVSREAGVPYHEKMLPLPAFILSGHHTATPPDIRDSLRLTGYFLEHWLLIPHEKSIPAARKRLVEMLSCIMPD